MAGIEFISLAEIAERWRMSYSQARRIVLQEGLPICRFGRKKGAAIRIDLADLVAYEERCRVEGQGLDILL